MLPENDICKSMETAKIIKGGIMKSEILTEIERGIQQNIRCRVFINLKH